MYCSSCGSVVTPGLSYCNRCGAELSAKPSTKNSDLAQPPPFPEGLVWAIVAVSVGGLGVIIALMAVMKNALNFANGLIVAFTLLSFFLLLAAEIVFIWLMVSSQRRGSNREREGADVTQVKGSATRELEGPRERLLSEPAVSVTDHTTRTLEPVYRHEKRHAD